jgi:hypothetical protein
MIVISMNSAGHVPLATSTGPNSRVAVGAFLTSFGRTATKWNVDRPA